MEKGIKSASTFLAFASNYGPKVQLGQFANKKTGEVFKSLILTNNVGDKTFVSFSSNLGELTAGELKARKHDLQVVQLNGSNSWILCKQGESWETVDLFD